MRGSITTTSNWIVVQVSIIPNTLESWEEVLLQFKEQIAKRNNWPSTSLIIESINKL
jgi:hypothetical protein